ncbi:MAG: Vitamin B12 dependent methionine synthase activation subunit [Clostridia bacterium]|nr:Vitamin B12 dependent methionine synthase activation subunit [Clostridia bacterium]
MLELCGKGVVDIKQTLRYLGYSGGEVPEELLSECRNLILPELNPRAVYEVYDVNRDGGILDLGFVKTRSKDLYKNLEGCEKIALFAATVGTGVDRLILKYNKLSPARAVVLQAMGSSAVECWCDEVNAHITQKFKNTKPRFSCGYGDFPLSVQREIFSALDVTRRLGINLNENLFMTPSKSVTAVIGIL